MEEEAERIVTGREKKRKRDIKQAKDKITGLQTKLERAWEKAEETRRLNTGGGTSVERQGNRPSKKRGKRDFGYWYEFSRATDVLGILPDRKWISLMPILKKLNPEIEEIEKKIVTEALRQ